MKKPGWSVLLVNSGSNARVRQLPFGKVVLGIVMLFVFFGLLGLGRCMFFVGSYGFAKLALYYNQKENEQLRSKIIFLSKYIQEERNRIDKIMSFEDHTRLKFGLDPISSDVRLVGVGGRPNFDDMLMSSYGDPLLMKADTIRERMQKLLRQVELEDTTFGEMVEKVDRQYQFWEQRPATMPVWGRLTSLFGYRVHPFTGFTLFHEGVDISNEIGTPIHATANGVVAFCGVKDYYGNLVVLSHPASGYKTIFGHLKKAAVFEGQVVKRGDVIGYLGNTGRSTGPHVHYEVHRLNDMVNPLDYVLPTDTMVD